LRRPRATLENLRSRADPDVKKKCVLEGGKQLTLEKLEGTLHLKTLLEPVQWFRRLVQEGEYENRHGNWVPPIAPRIFGKRRESLCPKKAKWAQTIGG